MEATLLRETVSVVVPVTPLPSLAVAVMVTVPVSKPVTKPEEGSTVAFEISPLLHSTSLLAASSGSTAAVNCGVPLTITPGEGGIIVIDAAFLGVTVSSIVPVTPLPSFAVAVMVTAPVVKPLTKPSAFTAALVSSLLLHVTPLSAASSGRTAAVNCWVLPAATLAGEGVMAIEVIFLSVTVSSTAPVTPLPSFVVAVMVAVPSATPVAKPLVSTAALDGSLLLHDTS